MRGEGFWDARRRWEAIRGEMDALLHGTRGVSASNGVESAREALVGSEMRRTIRDVMTPDPITIRAQTPLDEALERMRETDLSAVPVVDELGRVVGLLNERHLLTALGDPDAIQVSEVMDPETLSVGVDEPIVEVIDRLMTINVRQVFVLDGTRLLGVVTRADLMPAVLEELRERSRVSKAAGVVPH